MAQNSMEIVEEGLLESISRPTSSSSRPNQSIELPLKPMPIENNCLLELLPDDIVDIVASDSEMEVEDVVDTDDESSERELSEASNTVPVDSAAADECEVLELTQDSTPTANTNDEPVDPKIKKGLAKIRKLDSLLEEVGKKEKEVKDDRRKVEKELRLELRSLLEEKESLHKRVGFGVQQLLALCEGEEGQNMRGTTSLESGRDEFSPVFQTQIDLDETSHSESVSDTKSIGVDSRDSSCGSSVNSFGETSTKHMKKKRSRGSKMSAGSRKSDKSSRKNTEGKQQNFIERNIKLASHAGDYVALTDEERKRLDELLSDESDLFSGNNPFSTSNLTRPSIGFHHDEDASASLLRIDAQLKDLIPDEEYSSICLTSRSEFSLTESCETHPDSTTGKDAQENLCSRKSAQGEHCSSPSEVLGSNSLESGALYNEQSYGDNVLQQTRHFREIQQRLNMIERQLKKFQPSQSDAESALDPISGELLRQLLDVDSRATSTALSIMDVVSGRLSVAETSLSDFTSTIGQSDCADITSEVGEY